MKRLLLINLFLVLISTSFSQVIDGLDKKQDSNGFTYHYSKEDPLKTRIYTLENGLTIYLSDYKAKPRVQTFVAVRSGSKDDPSTNTGLAHYLEHILFKGTSKIGTSDWEKEKIELNKVEQLFEEYKNIPFTDSIARKKHYAIIDSVSYEASKYAIANEYDKLVGGIGAKGTNAYTWFDQTVYINDIPANQIENWAKIEAERFSEVVPRLFHTELEAVYEEKNRGLDNDGRRVWEEVFEALFPNHKYGTQTTIGTIPHLKNPSITAIKEYFYKHYVASNMAICLSGDLDLDKTIKTISSNFASYPSKTHENSPKPAFSPEIAKDKLRIVKGPSAESVTLAFKFDGASTDEALMMELVSMLLSNSQAGLIDLNLNQEQKVLGAYSYPLRLNDYSLHILSAKPRAGQSLEEVKELLLSQLELLAQGEFEDWLLDAILTDYKLSQTMEMESNKSRATSFVTNFIRNESYARSVNEIDRISSIKRNQIIEFVKNRYSDNYVQVNKIKDEGNIISKVEKPSITPVLLNREKQSRFLQAMNSNQAPKLSPVFVDYKNDITKDELTLNDRKIPIIYNKNIENGLFEMYYIFDFGTDQNQKLGLALSYLNYLGCEGYTASELSQEFYKLGCSFYLNTSRDQVYIGVNGLSVNFDEALKLLEHLIKTATPDQEAYDELVASILQGRENSKLDKSTILQQGLVSYAKYGPNSPFTNIITDDQLKSIKPKELTDLVKSISSYNHSLLYYGPKTMIPLKQSVSKYHTVGEKTKTGEGLVDYKIRKINENKVYFVNYDMVQAEILILSQSKKYNEKRVLEAKLFNEYFGGGMGSIVFQELRESKALAYSVKSYYQTPSKLKQPGYTVSYIGTQADKITEAMDGMINLLDVFIEEKSSFENAKKSLENSIETSRSIKSGILFKYLGAQKLKHKTDINSKLYDYVKQAEITDIKKFHKKYFSNTKKTYLIIGSKETLDLKSLEKYGKVTELSLEQVFGY